jgi:multicomponent Na+:H+ antiporter subunit C
MELMISVLVGVLYGTGFYFLLSRSLIKLILGIIFLSNATNLLLLVASGIGFGKPPPFITEGGNENFADPLPQALILTAIVISFGIIAFFLVLKYKFYQATGTADIDELRKDPEE